MIATHTHIHTQAGQQTSKQARTLVAARATTFVAELVLVLELMFVLE